MISTNAGNSRRNLTCPTCGDALPDNPEPRVMPFCSARCKTIDLGRWFNEDISLPVDPDSEDELDELGEREVW